MSERYLTPNEVQDRLRLSRATIHRLRRKGTFPAPIVLGEKKIVFLESDIVTWLETRRRATYVQVGEAA